MGYAGGTSTRNTDDASLIAELQAELEQADYSPPFLATCKATADWLGVGLRRVMNYGYRYPNVKCGDQYDVRAVAMHLLRTEGRRQRSD